MPLILALLFAIPSYGLSIVLYIMWIFFKSNGKVDLRKLSNIEKAVYHVAENEKAFGAAFDEISYDDVFDYLISNDIDWYKDPFSRYEHIEFDIQIGRRKYNVNVGKEPDMIGKGAVFNAKRAISWVDELYEWARENFGTDLRFGKYYLQDQGGFVVVDQERPVWKASDPVIVPESFGNLTRLQILRIIEKDVVSLPRSIGKMKGLKEINLNRNALMSLPKEALNKA